MNDKPQPLNCEKHRWSELEDQYICLDCGFSVNKAGERENMPWYARLLSSMFSKNAVATIAVLALLLAGFAMYLAHQAMENAQTAQDQVGQSIGVMTEVLKGQVK